jgi:hypothetical protein
MEFPGIEPAPQDEKTGVKLIDLTNKLSAVECQSKSGSSEALQQILYC